MPSVAVTRRVLFWTRQTTASVTFAAKRTPMFAFTVVAEALTTLSVSTITEVSSSNVRSTRPTTLAKTDTQ